MHIIWRFLSAAAVLVMVLTQASAAAETRPVTFEDIMNMKTVGSPEISPDGNWVLYTVRQWESVAQDEDEDEPSKMEARTQIWRVAASGEAEPHQLTFGKHDATSPSWSPDGKHISFLSNRAGGEEGKPQIWLMRSDAGEAWQLTEAKEGVSTYAWSPDGEQIAFCAREPLSEEEEAKQKRRDDPRVYESDFRLVQLWTIEVYSKKAKQQTAGAEMTVRGKPEWSPDGRHIAFQAAPTPLIRDDRDDIYVLSLETGKHETVTSNLGPDRSPAWSPDGSRIAFFAEPISGPPNADGIPGQVVGNAHLMLYDLTTKDIRDLSRPDFDLSVGSPAWTADSKRILFNTGERVHRGMFAYELDSGRFVQLTKGRNVSFGSMSKDTSKAAFVMDSSSRPPEVHVSGLDFSMPTKLTQVNPQVDELSLGDTEIITWKSDDFEIEGLLLKPVGYERGKRYPLLVVVHGGPTGAYIDTFMMSRGDAGQHWAGQGWAVLYPNPRGSTNYGEEFMRANILDWGGGDYRDIMRGADAVIERGIADPDKLAVMGWSYGGYMTCWVVSQTSRFKAAMMGAGLSNLPSMYGTNDIPNYLSAFFDGNLSTKTWSYYKDRSGLTYADQVTTPLLILHGGNDQRVPIGQPMEFFRALKDRGTTVELVFYPREGHGLREYYHRLDRMKRQYEWITRYTLKETSKATTN